MRLRTKSKMPSKESSFGLFSCLSQEIAILTKGEIIIRTVVYELNGHRSLIYTVPPEKAVVDAYYQHELNNYNTWEYDYSKAKHAVYHNPELRVVYCGNFAARC